MDNYKNITEALINQKDNKNGITFLNYFNEEFLSYKDLFQSTLKHLRNLQNNGMKPGDKVLILIEDAKHFITMFWTCLLGGFIPVPIAVRNNHEHKLKIFKIWDILEKPYILTTNDIFDFILDFAKENMSYKLDEIKKRRIKFQDINLTDDGEIYNSKPEDIAFIQFSSGTTGDPKGVVLTHKNLSIRWLNVN